MLSQGRCHLLRENSPAGQGRVRAQVREISTTEDAIKDADVVILAVPDTVLGVVSHGVVPQMKSGAILPTLDPAAADAGLLAKRLAPWPNSPEAASPPEKSGDLAGFRRIRAPGPGRVRWCAVPWPGSL